jgi:hypothetical protein
MIILFSETQKELKVGDVIEESVSDRFSCAVVRPGRDFSYLCFVANDIAHCGVFALSRNYTIYNHDDEYNIYAA